MQLGAINSVNFGKKLEPIVLSEDKIVIHDDCEECDVFEKHQGVIDKTKNDVSPLTCVLGVATGLLALKKGSKAVSIIRSAFAKGADEVLGLFKKFAKIDELPKALSNLTERFGKEAGTENKYVAKFTDVVDSIFGNSKAEKTIKKLNDNGIYLNGKSVFDNAIAAVGAYMMTNIVSDKAEETIDGYRVNESAKKVREFYDATAKTIAATLVE